MVRLYPPVQVKGQSFKHVKRNTVPNLALSLREILRRYVRREPMPTAHDGYYEERFGDIEKMKRMDIVDQLAKADELHEAISAFEKREKDNAAKAKADADKVVFDEAVQAAAQSMAKSAPPARGPAEGDSASSRS